MRTLTIKCDVCSKVVDDFNGGVTVAAGWGETIRADACSVKCVIVILKGLAAEILAKGEKITADNAAFLKQNPDATVIPGATSEPSPEQKKAMRDWGKIGPPPPTDAPVSKGTPCAAPAPTPPVVPAAAPSEPGPAVVGCAACDRNVEFTAETAHTHTGEGPLCRVAKASPGPGPCTCTPDNWKMEPNNNAPGPHEVACQKCGLCWTSVIKDMSATTGRKGRPAGSKNKKTLAAEAAAAAAAAGTNGSIPVETPENKPLRDEMLGRTPTVVNDELARLAQQRSVSVVANGSGLTPEGDLSQLVTDVAKLGVTLPLPVVAQMTGIQRDLLRGWVLHPEFGPPEFLGLAAAGTTSVEASLPAHVPAAAPAEAPKSRFTF